MGWSVLLIIAGLWNLFIWPQFFRRIAKDERSRNATGNRTKFFTVHAVLIAISLVLGFLTGLVGVIGII